MPPPTSFTNAPDYGSHHPPATPATVEPQVAYVPRKSPTLTVYRDERAYLNAEATRLLPPTSAVELMHPVRVQRDHWHLNTQPGGRCRLSPTADGAQYFRAPIAARTLFEGQPAAVRSLRFELEHVGNGIFRLYPLGV